MTVHPKWFSRVPLASIAPCALISLPHTLSRRSSTQCTERYGTVRLVGHIATNRTATGPFDGSPVAAPPQSESGWAIVATVMGWWCGSGGGEDTEFLRFQRKTAKYTTPPIQTVYLLAYTFHRPASRVESRVENIAGCGKCNNIHPSKAYLVQSCFGCCRGSV